jgi:exodeoxyribonuclease V gamma subunit
LAHPEQPLRVCLLTTPKKDKTPRWDTVLNAVDPVARGDDLERRLLRLIALWQSAEQHPLAYLPKTAWAAATHDDERRMAAMRSAWASGSHHTGERDFAPGYTQWLARGIDPVDPHGAETQTLIATAAMLRDLISFGDSERAP